MSPIRVAIIGLSANAITDWASRAHLPYLLSSTGKSKFQIVALCNTSVAAADRSIKTFRLPAATKAYGSPEDLAADPDVDLVICATRVDKHYETSLPSVRAGKDVFIEWPVAENGEKASELARVAKEAGGRGICGLQVSVSACRETIQYNNASTMPKGVVHTVYTQAQGDCCQRSNRESHE